MDFNLTKAWANLPPVPDLTFSEMRFLQKQPSSEHEQELQSKSRKRDRAPVSNEEFSAYFATNRPALAEMTSNVQTKAPMSKPKGRVTSGTAHRATYAIVTEPVVSAVGVTGTPSLGFDSSVAPLTRGNALTLSESLPEQRRPASAARERSQLDSFSAELRHPSAGTRYETRVFGSSPPDATQKELRAVHQQFVRPLTSSEARCEQSSQEYEASRNIARHSGVKVQAHVPREVDMTNTRSFPSHYSPHRMDQVLSDRGNVQEDDELQPHQTNEPSLAPRSSPPILPAFADELDSAIAETRPEHVVSRRLRDRLAEHSRPRAALSNLEQVANYRPPRRHVPFATMSPTYMGQRLDETVPMEVEDEHEADRAYDYDQSIFDNPLTSGGHGEWAIELDEYAIDDTGLHDEADQDDQWDTQQIPQNGTEEEMFAGFWQPNILYS